MVENKSIQAYDATEDIMDYKYLKEKGLEELQKLTGNIWTDYNHHDPGITVLEILSYALTELGFRSRYPVRDILFGKEDLPHTLYAPSEILPSRAITLKDYHKIILDIEGIKDVIIYPSPRFPEFGGIYAINIELLTEFEQNGKKEEVIATINEKLQRNRNLCETFDEITFIQHVPVSFEIDVEVNDQQDLNGIFLDIYRDITEYLAPSVTFYSLADLLEQGFSTDDIFTGPLLENGFVLESDFERIDSRNKIFASDIIHFIMDIVGVEMIKKFQIVDDKDNIYRWYLGVERGKAFKLDLKKSKFRFFKVGKEVHIKDDLTQDINKIDQEDDSKLLYKRMKFDREAGTDRSLSSYSSIQHDFPDFYGIGELGLLPSASPRRKAQAKQFKAYLLFFEQILTNFFGQLEDLADLFSIRDIKNTYSTRMLKQVPGIEYLYREFVSECIRKNLNITDKKTVRLEWKKQLDKFHSELNTQLNEIVEDNSTFYDRRNRILDHLLARLAFCYTDYRFDFETDEALEKSLIEHKTHILSNFIPLSCDRSKAFINLEEERGKADNISGLQHRINTFLKLKGSSSAFPFEIYRNGIFQGGKQGYQKDEKDLSLAFYGLQGDDAIKNLFLNGTNKLNFSITEAEGEGEYKTELIGQNGTPIGKFQQMFKSEDRAAKVIDDFVDKLTKVSEESEGIYVIERVLYRPHLGLEYFTFSIWLNKETLAFINQGYLTFEARNEKVATILNAGINTNNYSFIELSNQFKILLNNTEGEPLLTSHRFFNSREEVEKEIDELAEMFLRIQKGTVERLQHFRFYTKHYDLFNLADNPYSFIATILIPSWPVKFQNQAFKTLLENKIKEETPAHIFPDIKWVGIKNMVRIIDLTKEYNQLLEAEEIDFEKLSACSDELFRFFVKL